MEFDDRIYNYEHIFQDAKLSLEIGDIFKIAETSLKKGTEIPMHMLECNQVTFCVSGNALIKVGDSLDGISEGQVHFVKKGINHSIIVSKEKNFRYICMGFVPNSSNPTIIDFEKTLGKFNSFVINDNGYIKRLSELLICDLHMNDNYRNEMINTFISQILMTIIRIFKNNDNDSVLLSRKAKKNSAYAIYEVLRYIDKEYLTITSVRTLADMLNYSESYLSHLFAQKIGTPLKEYIIMRKIEHAIELLRQCDMTVEDISEHLAFSSVRVFRRAFKQYTGHTPSYFRDN